MTRAVLLGDIADIQTGPFGSQLHKEDYVEEGVPIITVEHLGGDRITTQNLPRVTESDKQRLSKYWMNEGDTIFSRVGSVDRASYVHSEENGWLFSGRCLRVRPDIEKVNPRYLSFVLRSPQFTNYIKSIAVGATMPSINTKLLSTAPVVLIPRNEQEKVAATLDSIERKIELNRQMNETLEQVGKALFRHYFIDSPEATKWDRVPIMKLCEKVASGGTPSTNNDRYYGGEVQWYSTKELRDGFLLGSEKTISEEGLSNSAAKLFPKNTVTMAIYAAPTVGRLGILTGEASFNQATCGLIAKPEIGYEFIYLYLLLSRAELNNMANGAAQQNISVGKVRDFKVMLPDSATLNDFRGQITPIFDRLRDIAQEIKTLAALRDTLLPRLIEGKLKL